MSLMLKKKGGKVFAPKLPVRRPGAPSSAQSSARPSVERQSQTPAPPAPPETITIPDDDETRDLANDHTARIIDTTPHQPLLEKPQDAPTHTHPTLNASAHNSSAYAQNRALPPDKESLKRKTRDHEAEVEVPQKRHQSSSLDVPRSTPKSAPVEQSQVTDSHPELAQPSESARLSTLQPPQQPSEPSQPSKAALPTRDDVATDELPRGEATGSVESSQANPRISETAATLPCRQPLPESAHDGPASETPDNEVTLSGLGSAGASSGLGAAGDVGLSGVEGGQLAHTPVIVPMAPLNPDGTPGEVVQQPTTGTKKKIPKRRKIQDAENGDDIRATVEMQLNRPRRAPGKKTSRKKKEGAKKSSKRAETPEGAELEEIDTQAMSMADMCKDLRIGRKFSMHDELRQREKQKIIKAKLAKHPELAGLIEGVEEGGEGGEATTAPEAATSDAVPAAAEGGGLRMRIIDGQIVVDESSMQVDRHQISQAGQGEMEQITENEFSQIITSGTHMKREKAQLWDMAANETFYKGLRMFGTDFEMIAGLFPHRTRRQIKLKFCKEEKDNPVRIDKILKGVGSSIELDTFEKLSGKQLEEVADIEAERVRIEAEQQAEEDRRIAEQAEAERKKREAITAKAAAVKKVLAAAGDSGDEVDSVGDNGDPGEKENQPRQAQLRGNNPKELPPGEKPKYPKAAKALKAPKQGAAKNKRKKNQGGADETVQVLGDA